MCSALDLPWSAVVSATDSSEYGYGVCERKLDVPLISRTARTCEQWRFAVEGAVKARANALKLDPNCDCPPDTELYQEARVHERNFEEVHPYILRPADWHVVFKGEWQHQENILRTEGRALVSGVRHHLRCRRFAGCRHLYLVDNLALALACCKGRGSSHLSNRTCQQLCALALVGDCKFYVRWIPSERNCADRPSRCPSFKCSEPYAPPGLKPKRFQSERSAPSCTRDGLVQPDFESQGQALSFECPGIQEDRRGGGHGGHFCHAKWGSVGAREEQGADNRHAAEVRDVPQHVSPVVPDLLSHVPGLGCFAHGLPERALCPGAGLERSRIHVRSLPVPVPRVREIREPETPEDVASARRLPQLGASTYAAAHSSDCIRGDCGADVGEGSDRYGSGTSVAVGPPASSRRAGQLETSPGGPASAAAGAPIVGRRAALKLACRGHWRPKQNQRFQREPPVEPGDELPASCAASPSEDQGVSCFPVSVHLCSAGRGVQKGDELSPLGRPAAHSVRESTWRRKPFAAAGRRPQGDQTARQVACGLKCEEVRKGNSCTTSCAPSAASSTAVRHLCRVPTSECPDSACSGYPSSRIGGTGTSEQSLQAPTGAVTPDVVRKHLRHLFYQARKKASLHKHHVFLELFAGRGVLSRCLRSKGYGVISLDVANSPLEDLCNRVVFDVIRGWLSSGAVLGVWLGTPCTTWCFAHNAPVVRLRSHIFGKPRLIARHHETAAFGNYTMLFSARVIALCIRLGVPCFLENPHSSMLFKAPAIAELLGDTCCQSFVSDYCQYGARWRRTTRVCTWLSTSEAPSRRCCGSGGQPCPRSQQKHIRLSDRSAQGSRCQLDKGCASLPPLMGSRLGQLHDRLG